MTTRPSRLDRLATRVAHLLWRRAMRARHNDFDFACRFWWGDRNPDPGDRANRDFGGAPTRLDVRRCLVCRPYDHAEGADLLDPATTGDRR